METPGDCGGSEGAVGDQQAVPGRGRRGRFTAAIPVDILYCSCGLTLFAQVFTMKTMHGEGRHIVGVGVGVGVVVVVVVVVLVLVVIVAR